MARRLPADVCFATVQVRVAGCVSRHARLASFVPVFRPVPEELHIEQFWSHACAAFARFFMFVAARAQAPVLRAFSSETKLPCLCAYGYFIIVSVDLPLSIEQV